MCSMIGKEIWIYFNMSKLLKFLGLGALAIVLVGIVFWGATYVAEQESLRIIIEKFGFVGIFLVSFISNLNLIVPLHAATFSPVFIERDFLYQLLFLQLDSAQRQRTSSVICSDN